METPKSHSPKIHSRSCRYFLAVYTASGRCIHGFDACPMCDPCTCSPDPSDVVQAHRQAVLDSLSGEYETPEDRALVDALIEAVRAQCAAQYTFAVLSASTLGGARHAVERFAAPYA